MDVSPSVYEHAAQFLSKTPWWVSRDSELLFRVPHVPQEPIRQIEVLENEHLSPLFLAAVESVEEAVYNSLTKATTITGRDGRTVEAIPVDELRKLLNE